MSLLPISPRRSTWLIATSLLIALALASTPLLAEGSRELIDFEIAQGGNARYGLQSRDLNITDVPNWVIFQVYAQAGETIHLGSNTMHTGLGNIYLWDPATNVISDTFPAPLFADAIVDCVDQAAGDTTVGLIDTRAKELAGPEVTPGDGGYVSCQHPVETPGLYFVFFRAVLDDGSNADNMPADDPNIGTQMTTGVHAWDVTVRSAGGEDLPGRLMATWMTFYEDGGGGPDMQLHVLTRDGHRYLATFDEVDGLGFNTFSNNKGIQDRATGEPTYLSWQSADVIDDDDPQFFHPPIADDTAEDFSNRLFVSPPDLTVVSGSQGLGDLLGYRVAPGFVPAPTGFLFDGSASGGGVATAPNGFTDAVFTFDSDPSLDGIRFQLVIDTDRNGSYDDTVDRRLSGLFDSAGNSVPYDGEDAAGNALTFDSTYTARIQGTGSEIHFPFGDIENFPGGMRFERLTNPSAGDVFRAAYDDFNGAALSNTAPVSLPGGGDSSAPGFHTWTGNSGNNDFIDTWTFAPVTGPALTQFAIGSPAPVPPAFSKSFSPNPVPALESTTLTFTVDNQANAAAANALTFSDTFPAGMTVADPANSASTCGGTVTATPGAGDMSFSGGSVAAGGLCTVQVDVTASSEGLYPNTSSELDSDLGTSPPAEDTLEVLEPLPVADLEVTKEASSTTVQPGETLFYTVTVTNHSETVAVPDVVVSDMLPAGLAFVATVGCAEDPIGVPTCTLGNVPALGQASYLIETMVDGELGSAVVNTATVSSQSTSDPIPENDDGVSTVTVGSVVDVPTLGSVAMALLSGLLLLFGLWTLRLRD